MRKKLVIANLVATSMFILFTGCATKSNKIPPIPSSSATLEEYKVLNCEQLKDSYRQLETKNQVTVLGRKEFGQRAHSHLAT